jgi:hypothetical protein
MFTHLKKMIVLYCNAIEGIKWTCAIDGINCWRRYLQRSKKKMETKIRYELNQDKILKLSCMLESVFE